MGKGVHDARLCRGAPACVKMCVLAGRCVCVFVCVFRCVYLGVCWCVFPCLCVAESNTSFCSPMPEVITLLFKATSTRKSFATNAAMLAPCLQVLPPLLPSPRPPLLLSRHGHCVICPSRCCDVYMPPCTHTHTHTHMHTQENPFSYTNLRLRKSSQNKKSPGHASSRHNATLS